MKKIGKILFTFAFLFTGIFGITSARAEEIPVNFFTSLYPDTYNYAMDENRSGAGVSLYKGDVTNLITAARAYYGSNSGATSVGIVPFELIPVAYPAVFDGNLYPISATIYIRIPDEFLKVSFADGEDALSHIKLGVLKQDNGTYKFAPVYEADNATDASTSTFDNGIRILKGKLNGNEFTENENGEYYVKYNPQSEIHLLNNGENVLFAIFICNAQQHETIVPTPEETTTTTTTTTTTVPTTVPEETTTTIENPKTLDGSNSAYIIIGVIGLIGILGLGTKFAKASK